MEKAQHKCNTLLLTSFCCFCNLEKKADRSILLCLFLKKFIPAFFLTSHLWTILHIQSVSTNKTYSVQSEIITEKTVLKIIFQFFPQIIQIYSTVPLRMLEKPRACPDGLYEVMKSCWELEPQRRPSFQELCKKIDEVSEWFDKPL